MVRERKDFYQLKKAVGGDLAPEPQPVVEEVPAGAGAEVGAGADPLPKRKKKKAHKGRSTAEVEVEIEVDAGPETEVASVGPDGSSKKRTAREEVIFGHLYLFFFFLSLCTGTNHFCSSLNR